MRGIPVRMELGPRDLDQNQAVLARRDTGVKKTVSLDAIGEEVEELLQLMQQDMLAAARERREKNSIRGGITYDRFKEVMEGAGAFVYAGWCGGAACEATIKEETKATIRCLPDEEFQSAEPPTTCLHCGKPSTGEALWARAY
jgi:prolyl-tRNA synthetase